MSDQIRAVVFVVIALVILFAWGHFYKPPVAPQPQPAQTAVQETTPQVASNSSAGSGGIRQGTAAVAAASATRTQAAEEKSVVVESPLYLVELSNRGGVVRSWKLKKYSDDQKPAHLLDLVNNSAAQQLGRPFSLVLSDSQLEAKANSALYEVTPGPGNLTAPTEITFHWSDGHLDVTKKLNFGLDYVMSAEVSVLLDGNAIPAGIAWRGGFGDRAVYKAASLVTVYYKLNDKLNLLQYKKLGVSGNQSQPALQNGPMEYLGIEDQFFTAAFLPDGAELSLWHWTQDHGIVDDGKPASEPIAEMAAGTTIAAPLVVRVFVGPKDLKILEKTKPPLAELINFGWTGVIAKPLLWILQTIHTKVPNYGWCIILLTLVINFAMFPLKMKSWRSMQKMQKVGPEVRQIQDRYKKYSMSDPRKRKMNEEVMAVYSREGINPMGSCLPMLIQLPFLWAFYRMLSGAIELRHAPWIFWIHDLSAKDPYYVLPIVMTLTSFLMMKMTPQPTAGDPAQQKMMAFMPLMMGAIFINLSSGLNLYYFVNNLVGMGQQWYLNRTMPPPNNSKFKNKKKE